MTKRRLFGRGETLRLAHQEIDIGSPGPVRRRIGERAAHRRRNVPRYPFGDSNLSVRPSEGRPRIDNCIERTRQTRPNCPEWWPPAARPRSRNRSERRRAAEKERRALGCHCSVPIGVRLSLSSDPLSFALFLSRLFPVLSFLLSHLDYNLAVEADRPRVASTALRAAPD